MMDDVDQTNRIVFEREYVRLQCLQNALKGDNAVNVDTIEKILLFFYGFKFFE